MVTLVMLEFLCGGDLLVLLLLASQMLFSRRLDVGLRELASAHREA